VVVGVVVVMHVWFLMGKNALFVAIGKFQVEIRKKIEYEVRE
jgi:hypothetical protein